MGLGPMRMLCMAELVNCCLFVIVCCSSSVQVDKSTHAAFLHGGTGTLLSCCKHPPCSCQSCLFLASDLWKNTVLGWPAGFTVVTKIRSDRSPRRARTTQIAVSMCRVTSQGQLADSSVLTQSRQARSVSRSSDHTNQYTPIGATSFFHSLDSV